MSRDNNDNLDREKKKLFQKKINKFLNDNFKWFLLFIISIIFIFGFFKLIIPQYRQTVRMVDLVNKQGKLDVEKKRQELENIKDFLLTFSKIDSRYIEKVNSIIPNKYNKEELFTELNHIANNNSLFLQSINISDPVPYAISGKSKLSSNLGKISMNISIRGTDYKAFKNFLSSLENNLKLIDVTDIKFNPEGKSTELIINTYYLQ